MKCDLKIQVHRKLFFKLLFLSHALFTIPLFEQYDHNIRKYMKTFFIYKYGFVTIINLDFSNFQVKWYGV